MRTLFAVQYYTSNNPLRQKEIDECLLRNLSLNWIDSFAIFIEDTVLPAHINDSRILLINIAKRLHFLDITLWAQAQSGLDEFILIIANSDIVLPVDLLEIFPYIRNDDFIALNRYECADDCFPFGLKSLIPGTPSLSQDTWIFRFNTHSNIPPMHLPNVPMGVPGCENRLAAVMHQKGYHVQNPCIDLRTLHVHASGFRSYNLGDRLSGLYAFPRISSKRQFCSGLRKEPWLYRHAASDFKDITNPKIGEYLYYMFEGLMYGRHPDGSNIQRLRCAFSVTLCYLRRIFSLANKNVLSKDS